MFIADDGKLKKRFVRSLPLGSLFGEISLVFQCKRTASVVSKNYSTCSMLLKEDFEDLNKVYP